MEPYKLIHGDCIEYMATMEEASIDFSIFSPPFPSLYAYSSLESDIGNSEDLKGEAKLHLSFFYKQFARILKPGRVVVVHVMQIPRMKRTGEVGLFDFRGLNIKLGERAGLVFEYDWAVRKNPQAQAIRTRSRELQFVGLESDRAKSRPMTDGQRSAAYDATGQLFVTNASAGGIAKRSRLAQIGKGTKDIQSNKPLYIKFLVDSCPEESTIIWCLYNDEQERIAKVFPDAANISGATPYPKREILIDEFKSKKRRVMISKLDVLGFGLNLQVATRQVFSGLQDSYESYYQAVKRSNRVGSTRPLNVHILVTEIEVPMVNSVLKKASRVQQDTDEQEKIFKKAFSR